MDIRGLKQAAGRSLKNADYRPGRLVLIHFGAVAAVSLVISLISYYLDTQVEQTAGLGSMQTRALLGTVQVVLQFAQTVLLPFWEAGLLFASLGYARQRSVTPGTLLEGFRRWKPILSSWLMLGLRYLGITFIAAYISSPILMATPYAAPILEAMQKLTEDPTLDPYALMGEALAGAILVYGLIFLVVFVLLALPVYYRYRMTQYVIMDEPQKGGLYALYRSKQLMFRKRMAFFKLDLSFWWYYLLEAACVWLTFGGTVLSLLGITLPMGETVTFYGFQVLSLVCRLGLYAWAKPKLMVAYAHGYESLLPPEAPESAPLAES